MMIHWTLRVMKSGDLRDVEKIFSMGLLVYNGLNTAFKVVESIEESI